MQPTYFQCSSCPVPGFAALISSLCACCPIMEYLTQKAWSLKDSVQPIVPGHLPCANPRGIPGVIAESDTQGSHMALSPPSVHERRKEVWPCAPERGDPADAESGTEHAGELDCTLISQNTPYMFLSHRLACTCERGASKENASGHPYFSAFKSLGLGECPNNASITTKS